MYTLILVIILGVAAMAVLAFLALQRGWLRLAPLPTETKGHFVLMLKKDKIRDEEKKSPS